MIKSLTSFLKQGSPRQHCLITSLSPQLLFPFRDDKEARSTNNGKTRSRRDFVTLPNSYFLCARPRQHSELADIVSIRSYHNTSKQQVLPLIALGLGISAIYSYRALQEMDAEWDDYYEQLQKYKAATGLDPEAPLQDDERRNDGDT